MDLIIVLLLTNILPSTKIILVIVNYNNSMCSIKLLLGHASRLAAFATISTIIAIMHVRSDIVLLKIHTHRRASYKNIFTGDICRIQCT